MAKPDVSPTTADATPTSTPHSSTRPRACIVRQVDRVEVALVRDSEALVEAGYDVDLVVMRIDDDHYWSDLPPGVKVVTLPVRRGRSGIGGYFVDYFAFLVMATVVVAARHLRRPYRLVQAVSLPDPLVIVGLIPRLLGAAVLLKVAEPTPQLSQSLGQPEWLQRLLGRLQICVGATGGPCVHRDRGVGRRSRLTRCRPFEHQRRAERAGPLDGVGRHRCGPRS